MSGSGSSSAGVEDEGNKTTDAIPWLVGFVKYHGKEKAMQLLEGAGLPDTYTRSPEANREWDFVFRDEYVINKGKNNVQQYESNYGFFLRNRPKVTTT